MTPGPTGSPSARAMLLASPAENVAALVSRLRRALGDGSRGRPARLPAGHRSRGSVDLDEASRWTIEAARRLAAAEPALAVTAASARTTCSGPPGAGNEPDAARPSPPARSRPASSGRSGCCSPRPGWHRRPGRGRGRRGRRGQRGPVRRASRRRRRGPRAAGEPARPWPATPNCASCWPPSSARPRPGDPGPASRHPPRGRAARRGPGPGPDPAMERAQP